MIGVFLIDICVWCDANLWIFVLTNRIHNSQNFEQIRSPQSLVVDLVVEVKGEEGEEEEEEEEDVHVNGDEDMDASEKGRCTSDVWNHFTRKKVNGKSKAQCHHCGKLYKAQAICVVI